MAEVKRKAGRPKKKAVAKGEEIEVKEVSNEVSNEVSKEESDEESKEESKKTAEKEVKKVEEKKNELEELKRQIAELKQLTEANTREVQKGIEKPKKIKYEDEHICCLIETTHGNLEAARQAKFYELADGNGGVQLECPRSGLSIYYKSLDEFPKHNVRVPCDPDFNTYYVRYKIVKGN